MAPESPRTVPTPGELRQKLHLARQRARRLRDPLLVDVLDWCAWLAEARPYLRHDPTCEHHRPPGPGPTRCTCGLERAYRRGRGPPGGG